MSGPMKQEPSGSLRNAVSGTSALQGREDVRKLKDLSRLNWDSISFQNTLHVIVDAGAEKRMRISFLPNEKSAGTKIRLLIEVASALGLNLTIESEPVQILRRPR